MSLDNPKHQRFCEEYILDLNGSAAYQRAAYKARGNAAETNAARLLRNAQVKAEIARLQQSRSERTQTKADLVLRELYRIALADIRKLYHPDGRLKLPHEWDDDTAAAVGTCDAEEVLRPVGDNLTPIRVTKTRLIDKQRAIDKCLDHLGLLSATITLESFLALLPPDARAFVERLLAGTVAGESHGENGPTSG